jgi:hypothetical protein
MGIVGYGTGDAYDEQIAASVPQSVQDERARIIAGYKDAAARTRGGGMGGGMPGMYGPMSPMGGMGGGMGMPAGGYSGGNQVWGPSSYNTPFMQSPIYGQDGQVVGFTPVSNPYYDPNGQKA